PGRMGRVRPDWCGMAHTRQKDEDETTTPVPLPHQALAILRDLQQITGRSKYLFPSVRSWHRPISDNTLNAALRRLGYDKTELTIHGLRSTASNAPERKLQMACGCDRTSTCPSGGE